VSSEPGAGHSPEVGSERTGFLKEGLELALIHTAFLAKRSHPMFTRPLVAGFLVDRALVITTDLDDIDPPLQPGQITQLLGFEALVQCAASIEDFVDQLPPEMVWRHAGDEADFALAISRFAWKIRRAGGCPNPGANCLRFSLGPNFVGSLATCQALSDGKHADTTLEVCARIV